MSADWTWVQPQLAAELWWLWTLLILAFVLGRRSA